MPLATFPSPFPEPLLSSYAVEPQPVSIRTDMDAGAARVRRRFTAGITNADVGWMVDEAQLATFRNFYASDIDQGAAWFTYTIDLGGGNASHECRFVDRYALRPVGLGNWVVVAKIEART